MLSGLKWRTEIIRPCQMKFLCVFIFQNAIANASSLAEVERLKGMLQAGQIPGRELRQGQCWSSTILENVEADQF